jgi:hypothetical protein
LIALDPSDFEKPESLHSEGLQKVVSPTARHLARPRRGFGGAPLSRPVTVPGFHFIAAVLMGLHGPAVLLDYRWWHKRPTEGQQTLTILELSHYLAVRYQQVQPIFVGDRGLGNRAVVSQWVAGQVRFVVRFHEHVALCATPDGPLQPITEFLKRQRGTVSCAIYDTKLRQEVTMRLRWWTVWLPQQPMPLALVIVRHPMRPEVWRLVTNLPVHTAQRAIHIAQIYARRWQVEWALRFLKSDLAVESPRRLIWERREKLLALLFLVYAWFVHLLLVHDPLVHAVLEAEAHRTGRRTRFTFAPLYRLHLALPRLLTRYLPTPVAAICG